MFALPVTLKPGEYTLVSRATDSKGVTQPETTPLNGSGYGHNGWRAPGVKITVA
jgi:sulfite oxidase